MRHLLLVLTTFAVMGLAFWAYQQNHRTKTALREVSELQRLIGQNRETLAILRAEWAYLNRPDRLRDLAGMNFDRLGLLPLRPDQFGRVDEVPFPRPPEVLVTDDLTATEVEG